MSLCGWNNNIPSHFFVICKHCACKIYIQLFLNLCCREVMEVRQQDSCLFFFFFSFKYQNEFCWTWGESDQCTPIHAEISCENNKLRANQHSQEWWQTLKICFIILVVLYCTISSINTKQNIYKRIIYAIFTFKIRFHFKTLILNIMF